MLIRPVYKGARGLGFGVGAVLGEGALLLDSGHTDTQ